MNLLDVIRNFVRKIMHEVARALNTLSGGRLSPNFVTLFGLVAHAPIAWLIATRHPLWAAGLLVIFGLFDTLDGELARLQNRTSKIGMLLDSITDRMKEVMLYIGVAYFFVVLDYPYVAVWAVAACGTSLLVSYVNAWGEAVVSAQRDKTQTVNQAFRSGLMSFDVRMFLLVIGLLTALLPEILILITILATFTAIGRLIRISRKLR